MLRCGLALWCVGHPVVVQPVVVCSQDAALLITASALWSFLFYGIMKFFLKGKLPLSIFVGLYSVLQV